MELNLLILLPERNKSKRNYTKMIAAHQRETGHLVEMVDHLEEDMDHPVVVTIFKGHQGNLSTTEETTTGTLVRNSEMMLMGQ